MKPALTLIVLTSGLFAQSFEVATIKPTPPGWASGRFIRMQSAHQLIAKAYTLRILMAAAFNLSPHAISGGPAWLDSDRYDILARTPGEARPTWDEQMAMLRQLLTERFRLTIHREPKEFSVYALTVAKSGSKLRESTVNPEATPEGPPPLVIVISRDYVSIPGRYATVGEMAGVMQRSLFDRPVLDRTGLTGRYDWDLEWKPDETQFGGLVKTDPESTKPDLFAAIQQQLGLKLEATKGLVDTIVIDKIERPSEN